MADEGPPEQEEDAGGGWIMTFADLMSLLMCFFVLLLSFAELDLLKFKAIAGSMKLAFGVQREVKAPDVPMGTSLIKTEFSPGKPEPTIVNQVNQVTADPNKQTLELSDALRDPGPGGDTGEQAEKFEQTQKEAQKLVEAFKDELDAGVLQIETRGYTITIRIKEKASFPSGQATFRRAFMPVIKKLRTSLAKVEGKIVVAGHTDNIPIKTARFRSNWDLSAARAVSVLHELIADQGLDSKRLIAEGRGDADPLVPNDTAANRALNRRVELTIVQPSGEADPVEEPLAMIGGGPASNDTENSGDAAGTAPNELPASASEDNASAANSGSDKANDDTAPEPSASSSTEETASSAVKNEG
ncbi:MAG: flagellar motor protein MotB [Pseudomonadota bacterium]